MKLNWGHKLVFFMVLFMAFIVFLISGMISQKVDVVASDYYEQEIAYQQEIDRKQQTLNSKSEVAITYQSQQEHLSLKFPEQYTVEDISGEIHFYRPSNADLDFKVPVKADRASLQLVDVANLPKGLWQVKVHWQIDGKAFMSESSVVL